MEILAGHVDWPSILLGRARRVAPGAGIAAAEEAGAWSAWRQTAGSLTPEAVVKLVSASGLRGRGGAGYLTGAKWRACAGTDSRVRYVVANGFEADPGAQLDRLLMERDPHAILEGLALAAYSVGATHATLVVNAGYSTAASRLRSALAEAESLGYLGSNAMGTGTELSIDIHALRGSFVAGEETVLLRALEDRRAQPDQRPPHPTEKGLWGKPTVVNNVETLAAVPWIVANGAAAYGAIGHHEAPGTMLIQVSGAVRTPGVVEVPMGTPLREVIEAAGGATGSLKAVMVGGPSGGFLPPSGLDTPLGFDELAAAGAILGSGTVLVADGSTCIVDLATLMTRYLNDESCGKTIPCRIGTRRLAELGSGFCSGRCRPSDATLLADLSTDIVDAALCGLEASAVNPLRSGMRYFAQEFEDHIVRGSCPAGVCHPIRVAAAVGH